MSNNDPFAVEETSSPSSNLSNQRHHSVGQSDPDTHCPNPMSARYRRAQRYMQAAYSTNPITFNTTLRPYWIDNSDCFWYIRDVPVNGKVTHQYRLVDANAKSNVAAFDQTRLAKVLEKEVGQAIDADQLPISDLIFNPTLQTLTFTAFDTRWLFDEHNEHCQRLDKMPEGYVISPNGKQAVFVRDYNLWIRDVATGKEHALTQDGEEFYRYASVPTLGKSLTAITDFLWSPDSSRLLTQVTDTRDVRIGMPLVKYTMPDGQVASILDSERRLSACGDEQIEAWQFLSIEVHSAKIHMFDCTPCPVRYPHYLGCFSSGRGWWDADSRHAYCIHQHVDETGTQLLKCDTHTGEVQVLFSEMPETHASLMSAALVSVMAMPLPERGELIWYSERSGWPHLYLYDLKSGQLKRALTQGNWVVRKILFYDALRQQLVIQTAGRQPGRNPYYQDICRVDLASGELTSLLDSDHEYTAYDRRGQLDMHTIKPSSASKGVSPTGNYLVTTRSRVDETPVALLLDSDGKELMVVEKANLSALPNNWQWPEPVMVKGADDTTDIYGVVFRPSSFAANKVYPVLDLSFTYSEPVGAFSNNVQGIYHYMASVAYAELGFIVVRFNNRGDGLRGSAGLRDRAFNAYRDTRLPFHNKADCVAGIRQLVQRFPYMDGQRVGVADFITVPSAISGMFAHPDCYKVGVSFNAMVGDGRFWSRAIYKDEGFPSFADLAHQLKGKFLMIHGMLDASMPAAAVFQVVQALQDENKPFDMLLLPNDEHGGSEYAVKRAWDYLVEHLLGETPPTDFRLNYFTPEFEE